MGKSSNTVIDTSCVECGHIPVNHLLCQKAPKPAEPAASEATKKSGREEMEGMRKKINTVPAMKKFRPPCQVLTIGDVSPNRMTGRTKSTEEVDQPANEGAAWGDYLGYVM